MQSHKISHKAGKKKNGFKSIRLEVPEMVNDALFAGAKKESERLSMTITKQDFLRQLLKKFADGEVEIKGKLFLLL